MYGVSEWEHFWITAWSFLVNHLWQSTAFAGFTCLAFLLFRGAPARLRCWIWIITSLKFVLPSALLVFLAKLVGLNPTSLLLSLAWASNDPVALITKQHKIFHVVGSSNPIFSDASSFFAGILLVWFSGTAACLGVWVKRYMQLSSRVREGKQLVKGREVEILLDLRRRLGIRRKVRLVTSRAFTEPGVWGIRKPVILFPGDMMSDLGDGELEAVMLHELAHIARYDNLVSNAQMIINSLFWFHPVVWWIDRKLLTERERACDDCVMEAVNSSRDYATGLVKVLQYGLGFKIAGVSCAGGSNLNARIRHIVSGHNEKHLAFSQKLVLALMVVSLFGGSLVAVDIGDCERYFIQKSWNSNKPAVGLQPACEKPRRVRSSRQG